MIHVRIKLVSVKQGSTVIRRGNSLRYGILLDGLSSAHIVTWDSCVCILKIGLSKQPFVVCLKHRGMDWHFPLSAVLLTYVKKTLNLG